MARSTIGWVGSALSFFQAATTLSVSWLLRTDGSYVGWLTSARIAPVEGSRATTAPRWLPSALSAAACALALMVSSRLAPVCSLPVRMSDDPAVEELVGGAGEQVVLGPLDAAAGAVGEGVVAGDVGVEVALRVGPQPLELVLGGGGLRDRGAADEDLAALAGVVGQQGAAVVRAVLQGLGLDELDEGRGDQQRAEQQRDDGRQAADGGVHRIATTSVLASPDERRGRATSSTGRRASSLMRSSRATRDQLASREEPP